MVFPIGAQIWELAADHLDRLPGKSLIDRNLQKCSVTEDGHARSATQPQQRREGRGEKEQWDGNDEQTSLELRRSSTESSELQVTAIKTVQNEHADENEDDVKEQNPVGQQRVDAEHGKDDQVVCREVAQVVVDSGLGIAKVLGLGKALEVAELGNGTQVGESAAERTRAKALETILQVEARRQGVQGNLNARHVGGGCESRLSNKLAI